MKRWLALPVLAAAMALFPMAAAANEDEGQHGQGDQQGQGDEHGHGDQDGRGDAQRFGPYNSASPDSGTCNNDWALDTFQRRFFVQRHGDGTVTLTETFNGNFLTIGGPSPGACQASQPHGTVVAAGIKGSFGGFETGVVTGATMYNPNGCSAPAANCTTTKGFLTAVFGPTATYSCSTGVGACSFRFDYYSGSPLLTYRHWTNASPDLGGNRGDIATA